MPSCKARHDQDIDSDKLVKIDFIISEGFRKGYTWVGHTNAAATS